MLVLHRTRQGVVTRTVAGLKLAQGGHVGNRNR